MGNNLDPKSRFDAGQGCFYSRDREGLFASCTPGFNTILHTHVCAREGEKERGTLSAMARPGIGKPRQAVTSYKDDLSGMWEKPTTKWTADLDPAFSFQGLNSRQALSTLNRRFHEYLKILKDQSTATALRNFAKQCLDARWRSRSRQTWNTLRSCLESRRYFPARPGRDGRLHVHSAEH